MIVVAIICILAAIAIPAYSDYTKKSSQAACSAKLKSYSNKIFLILNDATGDTTVTDADFPAKACSSITINDTPTAPAKPTVVGVVPKPIDSSKTKITCTLGETITCEPTT